MTFAGKSRQLETSSEQASAVEFGPARKSSAWRTWARAARIHQWPKNLLVFVPAALTVPDLTTLPTIRFFLVFAVLCLFASASYVINDLVDISADRQHRAKRFRPFASGEISLSAGVLAVLLLLSGGGALLVVVPLISRRLLLAYFVTSLAYSFVLKRKPLLDVICLGFLFTLRIAAGAALLPNSRPYWLFAFSMFFFTSLALVKRSVELGAIEESATEKALPGRGYDARDLPIVFSTGVGSAIAAVVVFLIYLGDQHFDRAVFRHPAWLGLACAALAYWILRVWLLAGRSQMHGDPVLFALRDRASYVLGGLVVLALLLAW